MMAFIAKAKVNDEESLESYVFTGLQVPLSGVRTMRIRALLVVCVHQRGYTTMLQPSGECSAPEKVKSVDLPEHT
jgi:hypothetical protein